MNYMLLTVNYKLFYLSIVIHVLTTLLENDLFCFESIAILLSDISGRRQAIAIAATAPLVFLFNQSSISCKIAF